jgi:hypothetical protein
MSLSEFSPTKKHLSSATLTPSTPSCALATKRHAYGHATDSGAAKPTTKPNNKPSTKETTQPTKEETINPNALFQKGKVKNTGSGEGSGKGDGKGDGSNGGGGTGSDGTGSGHTFSLAGRGSKSLGLPPSKTDEVGSIVVTIWVNQQGEVVRAVSGARGTTIDNRSLWRHCETAARNGYQ